MLTRLVTSAISLAVVVAAYQLYATVMEPMLEPELAIRTPTPPTTQPLQGGTSSVTRYQRLLAAYFPAGHWSQTKPPKVIRDRSGEAMLVLGEYKHSSVGGREVPSPPNGQLNESLQATDTIELNQCAFLLFPTPLVDGRSPPRDAIIIEVPAGATLKFNDFNVTQGRIGKLVSGEFPGEIIIRSDMREPGPEDDLLVTTRDIRLNSKMLWTEAAVHFRLGPNVGQGRHLEIDFLEDERAAERQGGLNIAGARSLEIRSDVALTLYMEKEALFPADEAAGSNRAARSESAASRGSGLQMNSNVPPSDQPVDVRCTGPFRFDFSRYVASFEENVDVWQLDPNGPSDHMACQQLDVHLAPSGDGGVGPSAEPLSASERQQGDLGKLKPYKLVATGYPVVMDSPSREIEARGNHVTVQLDSRKFTLEGGGVSIRYGPNVLRCPALQYEDPAPDSESQLGNFWAEGPGSLEYFPDLDKPDEVLQVTWQKNVQLVRHEGQPLLMLGGRPRATMFPLGQLEADEIHVHLRELPAEDAQGVEIAGPDGDSSPLNVVPDWMIARDNVVIKSPQLSGQTQTLAVRFHMEPSDAGSDGTRTGGGRGTLGRLRDPGQDAQSYTIHADQLRLDVAVRGTDAEPTDLTCEGNVVFREDRPSRPGEEPLVVHGWSLKVSDIDRPASRIVVQGFPAAEGHSARPAEVTARGVTMQSHSINLDQGQNRLWIDGAGTIRLTADRDPSGTPLSQPLPVAIHWKGGLNFDGTHVIIDRDVRLEAPNDRVYAHRLEATVNRPIELGSDSNLENIEVAQVTCLCDEDAVGDNVVLDHVSRDEEGITSHEHVQLKRLTINQQTGAIDGVGPGTVRSWRYAAPLEPGGGSTTAADSPPAKKLHYLEVRFQRGLDGVFRQQGLSWLTFRQRVTSVYGPVDSWEQQINPNQRGGLPPGGVSMESDELTVSEVPTYGPAYPVNGAAAPGAQGGGQLAGLGKRGMGPVQLVAEGNVTIEGHLNDRGTFVAQAQRATFDESKNLFRLEGTPDSLATARRYPAQGGTPLYWQYKKLSIWLSPWGVSGEGLTGFEITPQAVERGRPFETR